MDVYTHRGHDEIARKDPKSLNVLINDKCGVSSVTTASEDITITGLVLALS
jgi:hypothetical protein